jgi:diguanylate cyclase (GGDEF)-like protein
MTTNSGLADQERHREQAKSKLEPLVAQAVTHAEEQGHNLSLAVLDVDAFRQINETYGHDVGDQVLKELPKLIESQASLPVTRWGGEEFAILCPEHSLEKALALAERIRIAVASHSFSGAGTVTVSLGVANHQTGKPAMDVIQRAIAATYQAKTNGRNQVVAG